MSESSNSSLQLKMWGWFSDKDNKAGLTVATRSGYIRKVTFITFGSRPVNPYPAEDYTVTLIGELTEVVGHKIK